MMKIGFIGGGKMAQALAKGFIKGGLTKGELVMASCLPEDTNSINSFQNINSTVVFQNSQVLEHSDVSILAVKPQVVPSILPELRQVPESKKRLLLSIAMGISLKTLESNLPFGTSVIRVMPNTPALVSSGATVYVRGQHATDKDVYVTRKLFSAVGICEEVPENVIDAVTALAGSGPAYVYMMIEALADGAVNMGLPRELAYKLASQTVIGAGQMVKETKSHPGQLKDDVTSPGGSTIAAIQSLEKCGFRSALISAIEVATTRCKEFSN